MSGTHGVFQHRSGYFYTILEEDFCEVFKSPGVNEVCRAYITSILEHLTNKQYEATGKETDLWVFMSLPEMARRMRHACSERTIHKELTGMINDGYIEKRRAVGKATMEYKLNLKRIRKALEALPDNQSCKSATYNLANLQEPSSNSARSTLQISKNDLANLQPRITIDIPIEETKNSNEGMSSPNVDDAPTSNVIDWKTESAKMRAIKKVETHVPQSQSRHDLSNLDSSVDRHSGRAALDEPPTEKGQIAHVDSDHRHSSDGLDGLNGGHDGTGESIGQNEPVRGRSVERAATQTEGQLEQTTRTGTMFSNTPSAQRGTDTSLTSPQGGAVQPAKSDTKEIQRRINEHRGYALEEKVDIVRERQAIKSWCSLHTVEEFERVMLKLKSDPFWGKPENYQRIGGLTLAKETPKALAAPTPITSKTAQNGYEAQHALNMQKLEERKARKAANG